MPEQGDEDVRQHLVGTVADENLLRRDAEPGEARSNRLLEAVGIRIRVKPQRLATVRQFIGNRRDDPR